MSWNSGYLNVAELNYVKKILQQLISVASCIPRALILNFSLCFPLGKIFSFFLTFFQCCGSGMFIPNPCYEFFHPGSASKNWSILIQKMVSKLSEIWFGLFIPDQDPDFLPIPDPWAKKAPDPGSATLQFFIINVKCNPRLQHAKWKNGNRLPLATSPYVIWALLAN